MIARLSVLVGIVVLASGCATIFNPGPTAFSATSNPSGATVIVTTIQADVSASYLTPAEFALDLRRDYKLTFELDGYRSQEIVVTRTINGWLIGSVLLGILPAVVDVVTGSMWNHTMTVAHVDFVQGASAPDGGALALAVVGVTDEDGNTSWAVLPLSLTRL